MKRIYISLIMVTALLLTAGQATAKPKVAQKGYLYGFVANFNDSVVYVTDIQEVDSVWYDDKTKFLISRSSYANQLRDYFAEQRNEPHRTCIAMFALTRKEAEKKYVKLRNRYTVKFAGRYDVRPLGDFKFKAVPMDTE